MDQQQSDDYNQCGSPKAKKIFINMLDQMQLSHSPKPKMHQQKIKDGKSMNLSSPSSYNSSSPSSTSSLSSTPNPQHQKHSIAHGQSINGSSEYISMTFYIFQTFFSFLKFPQLIQTFSSNFQCTIF